MPRSFQRRRRAESVRRCFDPHPVGPHLLDAGGGDAGASARRGLVAFVDPIIPSEVDRTFLWPLYTGFQSVKSACIPWVMLR